MQLGGFLLFGRDIRHCFWGDLVDLFMSHLKREKLTYIFQQRIVYW